MIIFDQVSKAYPTGNTVLENVSFHIEPGEFVILTGPSGAGKTTIGRLLIHDLTPSGGDIKVGDWILGKMKSGEIHQLRRHIGVVFQDYKIIPDKTVFENISLALEIINYPQKQIDERVKHLLELVGIPDKGELFPIQLSGGELQRVSMARALVVNPKIILADEPTGNLDWETADKIMDLFEKINQEGKTIIMATHHKLIINKLKKRVIELKDGKVISRGASLPQKKEKKVDESEKEM